MPRRFSPAYKLISRNLECEPDQLFVLIVTVVMC